MQCGIHKRLQLSKAGRNSYEEEDPAGQTPLSGWPSSYSDDVVFRERGNNTAGCSLLTRS